MTRTKDAPIGDREDGESAVLMKIAGLPDPYRAMGERLHALVRTSAPALAPRTWYGMPAYTCDGRVVCFFRGGTVGSPERFMTLGFTEDADLDDGAMWPIAFALKGLTPAVEEQISTLVKRAAG